MEIRQFFQKQRDLTESRAWTEGGQTESGHLKNKLECPEAASSWEELSTDIRVFQVMNGNWCVFPLHVNFANTF